MLALRQEEIQTLKLKVTERELKIKELESRIQDQNTVINDRDKEVTRLHSTVARLKKNSAIAGSESSPGTKKRSAKDMLPTPDDLTTTANKVQKLKGTFIGKWMIPVEAWKKSKKGNYYMLKSNYTKASKNQETEDSWIYIKKLPSKPLVAPQFQWPKDVLLVQPK